MICSYTYRGKDSGPAGAGAALGPPLCYTYHMYEYTIRTFGQKLKAIRPRTQDVLEYPWRTIFTGRNYQMVLNIIYMKFTKIVLCIDRYFNNKNNCHFTLAYKQLSLVFHDFKSQFHLIFFKNCMLKLKKCTFSSYLGIKTSLH